MSDHPLFFIVGVPRSGTTLLSVLLNNHPDIFLDKRAIAIRTLNFQQRVSRVIGQSPGTDSATIWRQAAARDERLQEFLNWDRLQNPPSTLGEFVTSSFTDRARTYGKKAFGDKSPDAITRLPELLSLFPRARLLHVVRDARPNVDSLVKRQYLDRKVAAQQWKDWNVLGIAAAEWLGPERIHRLRYEDLLKEPEATLQKVCAFLNVPFTPALLDLAEAPATQSSNAYVKPKIDAEAVTRWRNTLAPDHIRSAERICGDWLETFGYERLFPDLPVKDLSYPRLYLRRVCHAGKLIFKPKRLEMRDQQLQEVRLSLGRRLYLFFGTVAGGVLRRELMDAARP